MKYMGSKSRIANDILPIILKDRKKDQWYVEPFCGGCNTLDKVDGNRIGNDLHFYLISMYKKLSETSWTPPRLITEDIYYEIKDNQSKYDPALVGYVGFAMSFGAKWFGGYRRDKKGQNNDMINMKNQSRRAYNNIITQKRLLSGVKFYNKNYWELEIPNNSIIYCDPPYASSTKYSVGKFDHDKFWKWCECLALNGHSVFVSEYSALDGWISIWEKEITTGLDVTSTKKDTEKLFVYWSESWAN